MVVFYRRGGYDLEMHFCMVMGWNKDQLLYWDCSLLD